ncbi:MAG: EamA family transporter [Selenomonadaceae bacterium]|nr:EamA family transporter [Selenomonadaceae bacterium]
MIFLPMFVAVAANVLYHVASKSIPAEQNAFMGLAVNYATALVASAILFFVTPHEKFFVEASRTNWACFLMGLSITGVEAAFVMIYRTGGELSTASLIVSILIALAMLVVGGIFWHEQITARKIFGAALCIAGVVVLSTK